MPSTHKVTPKVPKNAGLRKSDEVQVITGEFKGSKGKIESFDWKNGKVFVAGVNVRKKHVRANMQDQAGGIIDKTMSVDISNVLLVDPKDGKPTRIGMKIEDGKKVRFAKRSGNLV
jgi:large subunit ribosomal protein L24